MAPTDALSAYRGRAPEFNHQVVDHAVEHVRWAVNTNACENYFSLLKRTIKGTYVGVEPFHLGAYLDEQSFRYNEREGADADRIRTVLSSVMATKRRPERTEDKVEASDTGDDGAPMERFKNLAKQVLNVSNAAVQEERRRLAQRCGSKKKSQRE